MKSTIKRWFDIDGWQNEPLLMLLYWCKIILTQGPLTGSLQSLQLLKVQHVRNLVEKNIHLNKFTKMLYRMWRNNRLYMLTGVDPTDVSMLQRKPATGSWDECFLHSKGQTELLIWVWGWIIAQTPAKDLQPFHIQVSFSMSEALH